MPLIRCPECRERISSYAKRCKHCGAARRSGFVRLLQVLCIAFGCFLFLFVNMIAGAVFIVLGLIGGFRF